MVSHHEPNICGTTTVGERGQVVIPADVRRRMNIKAGDKLLVLSQIEQMVGFMKADDLDAVLEKVMKKMSSKFEAVRKQIRDVK